MARISKEQKEQIRQEILRVASVKFTEDGYDGVSTKQIAKEVGIAEGTLFNYFDSKTHLFLEVYGDKFQRQSENLYDDIDLSQDVIDLLYEELYNLAKIFIKLPRGILSELMIASIKLSKKHPKAFERFVQLDFQYMEQTKELLDKMVEHHLLVEVDTMELSELIYSIMMYEFIMYLYNKEIEKETMLEQVKVKLRILLQGYIK